MRGKGSDALRVCVGCGVLAAFTERYVRAVLMRASCLQQRKTPRFFISQ
jgi:hypothetical protein